uniref:hypothetical protein n=1 Tax=Kineosporia sp. R_H_3 TaxID=1961848 RepID=UPI0018EA1A96
MSAQPQGRTTSIRRTALVGPVAVLGVAAALLAAVAGPAGAAPTLSTTVPTTAPTTAPPPTTPPVPGTTATSPAAQGCTVPGRRR